MSLQIFFCFRRSPNNEYYRPIALFVAFPLFKHLNTITYCPLGNSALNWICPVWVFFSNNIQWLISWTFPVELSWGEWHKTMLMISQSVFGWWFSTRQQTIIWAIIDPDLCRRIASLGARVRRWLLHYWSDKNICGSKMSNGRSTWGGGGGV